MSSRAALDRAAPLLEVRGIALRLAGQQVLDGVGFDVDEGGLVGLIGPNGAGKTSLLETIAGFLAPSEGEVRWRGVSLSVPERKQRIFYLPDGIRPSPDHRAVDLLDLFCAAYERTAARRDELVGALQLGVALHKRVRYLSKGFLKRLLLALGMLTSAPLLLFDEPLDGLDLHQVEAVKALVVRLRAERRTLLLSIHELSLAERLCESFLLLSEGRLLAAGDLAALRARASVAAGGLADVFLALT